MIKKNDKPCTEIKKEDIMKSKDMPMNDKDKSKDMPMMNK